MLQKRSQKGYPSRSSHLSRLLETNSLPPLWLTYCQILKPFFLSILYHVSSIIRAYTEISCSIVPAINIQYTLYLVNHLGHRRSMQPLVARDVPAKASKPSLPSLTDLCTIAVFNQFPSPLDVARRCAHIRVCLHFTCTFLAENLKYWTPEACTHDATRLPPRHCLSTQSPLLPSTMLPSSKIE